MRLTPWLIALLLATPALGKFRRPDLERVPVARLLKNFEGRPKLLPADHLRVARLHAMAWQLGEDGEVRAQKRGKELALWTGHLGRLSPAEYTDARPPKGEAKHLDEAIRHYRLAAAGDKDSAAARVGLAWSLLQRDPKDAEARALLEELALRLWSPYAPHAAALGLKADARAFGERCGTTDCADLNFGRNSRMLSEVLEYLLPLLDEAEAERWRARDRFADQSPRKITPLALGLRPGATLDQVLDEDARVRFDADGSGPGTWTWIDPEHAAWLVYAPGGRSVDDALQLFGSVTFWLPWSNGFDALCSLDDDGDGVLRGPELRGLALWRDDDGAFDAAELTTLDEAGVRALRCDSTADEVRWNPTGAERAGDALPVYDLILTRQTLNRPSLTRP